MSLIERLLISGTDTDILVPENLLKKRKDTMMIRQASHRNFRICVYIFISALCGPVLAGPAPIFVDHDGDGINDLYSDGNSNGIPDAFERSEQGANPDMTGELGDVFNVGDIAADPSDDMLSAYEGFCERRFRTRDLCRHRGGFNTAEHFGPGNGIGSGALSSACVSGRCQ
jgi:hypothetical protein